MAGLGGAWAGAARLAGRGVVRRGWAGRGLAWPGEARRGVGRRGEAGMARRAGRGKDGWAR
jgi:hypothetical protein